MSDSGSNFDESNLLANKEASLDIERPHKILAAFQTSFEGFETGYKNAEKKYDSFDELLGSLDDLNKQIDGLM